MTEELFAVLDLAKGDSSRNAFIEKMLWNAAIIKKAAKEAGIEKPVRRKQGRPKRAE